ncbi:hypothetical protein [Bradyrhizobium sp. LA2.1]|uniref:hypothetical protein n=1 Tax=Bradyrhizobium sp. LA2.1 TaxID=3156376 RepID=UPI003398D4B8
MTNSQLPCSAGSRDEARKHHADEWVRQIINAGGDENLAQQAVALAALNGLFDHVPDAAQSVQVRLATIEECAKLVEPKQPRPCDCERCYCSNRGDMEAVASWDADAYNAKAIRALAEPVDRYDEAMAAIDACIGPAHERSSSGNGGLTPALMNATTVSCTGLDITIACNDHGTKDALMDALVDAAYMPAQPQRSAGTSDELALVLVNAERERYSLSPLLLSALSDKGYDLVKRYARTALSAVTRPVLGGEK